MSHIERGGYGGNIDFGDYGQGPAMDDDSQIGGMNPAEFLAQEQVRVAQHLTKIALGLNRSLQKTNDRPYNTYIHRPFSGVIPAAGFGLIQEVFRVPAGRYFMLEAVVFGPVAAALTGPSGFYRSDLIDATYLITGAVPVVTVNTDAPMQTDRFVDSQTPINYLATGVAGTLIQGVMYGRLIPKDIIEGIDMTLPDEVNEPSVAFAPHTANDIGNH